MRNFGYLYTGLREMPVYSARDSNVGTPKGEPRSCLFLKNGAFINGSCAQQSNFGCEEKKTIPGGTAKMQALNSIHFQFK
jgi:hypothetical protein